MANCDCDMLIGYWATRICCLWNNGMICAWMVDESTSTEGTHQELAWRSERDLSLIRGVHRQKGL